MELRQVETFRAVAEELSFSRAAAKLGYVQSSVSVQVAALERELGVPLFDRLGRRIALTDAGEVMLAYSRKLIDLAGEAGEAVADAGAGSGEVAGSLTVSAPETLLTYRLPELLAFFHERHPRVRLSVRPSAVGRLVGSARRALEVGAVDVAFVLDAPLENRLEWTNLVSEPLVVEDVSVVAPPSHTLAHSPVVLPEDLSGETVLLPEAPESGCAYRGQFERHLAEAGVVPRETMEFQSIEAVKRCVAAGMGVSFVRREEKLTEEQKAYLGRLCDADGALADARRLTQDFAAMVRELEGEKLDGWLDEAEACEAPAMRNFAAGLRKDLAAVRARLTEEWSNGPVEGFVNKLKLVKRQGYGRAGFELLRARMLAA